MKIVVDARRCINIVSNEGGYETAECTLCNARGWLDNKLGYPHNTDQPHNKLVHNKHCIIGERLNKNGESK